VQEQQSSLLVRQSYIVLGNTDMISFRILDCSIWYQYRWKCHLGGYRSCVYVSKIYQSQTWSLYRESDLEAMYSMNTGLIVDNRNGIPHVPLGFIVGCYCLYQCNGRVGFFLSSNCLSLMFLTDTQRSWPQFAV
jgi:hypothetical protein